MKHTSPLPVVTIIVTTKNNETTIGACLESIVKQTYTSIELIVVDNNSTDKTKDIAHQYTDLVYNVGPERSAQRNYAAALSNGDYLMIIDSDMELAPTITTECVEVITESVKAVVIPEESFGVGFWAQCKALERSFYVGVDWIEAPRFFTKDLYNSVGGYDEAMSGGEDWDLRNRISAKTTIAHIDAVIRHNEGHLTLKEIILSRKYYAKGFRQQYAKPKVQGQKSGYTQAIDTFKLFFSHPGKLFSNPIYSVGMLFMKVVEFGTIFFSKKNQ